MPLIPHRHQIKCALCTTEIVQKQYYETYLPSCVSSWPCSDEMPASILQRPWVINGNLLDNYLHTCEFTPGWCVVCVLIAAGFRRLGRRVAPAPVMAQCRQATRDNCCALAQIFFTINDNEFVNRGVHDVCKVLTKYLIKYGIEMQNTIFFYRLTEQPNSEYNGHI